jgi:hypothetical protein
MGRPITHPFFVPVGCSDRQSEYERHNQQQRQQSVDPPMKSPWWMRVWNIYSAFCCFAVVFFIVGFILLGLIEWFKG